MKLLTVSRMKSFRACNRRHFFEYIEGVRPIVVAKALRYGDVTHKGGLETYWLARKNGAEGQEATAAALEGLEKFKSEIEDPFDFIKLRLLVAAYATVWNKTKCKVLAVEAQFKLPLINPYTKVVSTEWTRAGKIDAIIQMADGRIAILEHKTSKSNVSAGSDYRRRLALDEQISMYFDGARSLGFNATVCGYDILRKPQHSQKLATPEADRKWTKASIREPVSRLHKGQRMENETPEEFEERVAKEVSQRPNDFIERVGIYRSTNEKQRFHLAVWNQSQLMHMSEAFGADNVPNSDACLSYFGAECPYLGVCEGTAQITDTTKFKKLKNVHPELG